MPMYDRVCTHCQHQMIDCLEPVNAPETPCPECGKPTQRAWLTKPSGVIGDECDVWIKHGLCNEDGSPRRYTSKQEIRREEKRRDVVNVVRHVGKKGSDKSPHTTRWI